MATLKEQQEAIKTLVGILARDLQEMRKQLSSSGAPTAQQQPQEVGSLREGQAAIRKELGDIKKLLSSTRTRAAAPRQPTVSLKGQPFKGSEKAKLVMVEFSDYQ